MMGNYSLFQMWESHRQSLIAGHLFYVEQAKKRLLSQFQDINQEADSAADQWLKDHNHHFNPDFHSPGDFEEQAFNAGLEFYELLKEMQNRTRLSVVAGMYHEWDKQLHQWMVDQMRGWCPRSSFELTVWNTSLSEFAELVEPLGWDIRSKSYFAELDACRLVINVFKHGDGPSLLQLKRKYPDFLQDPTADLVGKSFFDITSHRHLSVSDEHIDDFSDAIVSFWRDVPQDICLHENAVMPVWLSKVLGVKGNQLLANSKELSKHE